MKMKTTSIVTKSLFNSNNDASTITVMKVKTNPMMAVTVMDVMD